MTSDSEHESRMIKECPEDDGDIDVMQEIDAELADLNARFAGTTLNP